MSYFLKNSSKIQTRCSCLEKKIRDNISTDGENKSGKTQEKLENFTNASHFLEYSENGHRKCI